MKENLIRYVREELLSGRSDAEVSAGDDLLGSGLVDFLAMMRLIAFIEQTCAFKIPTTEITIENFITIDAIDQYLQTKGVSGASA